MIAAEMMDMRIKPLTIEEKVDKALELITYAKVAYLPVVDNTEYFGMVSEINLLDFKGTQKTIAEFIGYLNTFHVREHDHLLEIIKAVQANKTDIVPVLNKKKHFIGAATVEKIAHVLGQQYFIQYRGSIIILSLTKSRYSAYEISRIVEENNANILGLFVDQIPGDEEKRYVTIKLNTNKIEPIIATFKRFDYEIVGRFSETEDEDLGQERLNLLFRLFDI